MEKLLSIGSVVQLHNGSVKLMITTRYPLYNQHGKIGYFDYSACLYPSGMTDTQSFFFNHEDISKVWFEGYSDESENQVQQMFKQEIGNIAYPKFFIEDIKPQKFRTQ